MFRTVLSHGREEFIKVIVDASLAIPMEVKITYMLVLAQELPQTLGCSLACLLEFFLKLLIGICAGFGECILVDVLTSFGSLRLNDGLVEFAEESGDFGLRILVITTYLEQLCMRTM